MQEQRARIFPQLPSLESPMIRFAMKPDGIFFDLVDCAITDAIDNYLNFDDQRDQEDWLCACMPRAARFFTAPQAKEQLLAIQKVHHDARLYEVTKYHWLLLYECLETFSHGFNEQPMGWLAKNGIQHIDFSNLVRLFFWDTAFLCDHLAKMSFQEHRTMLIWPETMGLSAGFKTHSDELAFTLCNVELTKDFEDKKEVIAWAATSSSYPGV